MREIYLLDDKGEINKNVKYKVNEDRSGIYLEGFTLYDKDITIIKSDIKGIILAPISQIVFNVIDVIQYKPWGFGIHNKGSGQMGIYKIADRMGREYFTLVKDYIADEGDWRISLQYITNTEIDMKNHLMGVQEGMVFYDYLYADKIREMKTKIIDFNREK